jgi:hypothetical protein
MVAVMARPKRGELQQLATIPCCRPAPSLLPSKGWPPPLEAQPYALRGPLTVILDGVCAGHAVIGIARRGMTDAVRVAESERSSSPFVGGCPTGGIWRCVGSLKVRMLQQ